MNLLQSLKFVVTLTYVGSPDWFLGRRGWSDAGTAHPPAPPSPLPPLPSSLPLLPSFLHLPLSLIFWMSPSLLHSQSDFLYMGVIGCARTLWVMIKFFTQQVYLLVESISCNVWPTVNVFVYQLPPPITGARKRPISQVKTPHIAFFFLFIKLIVKQLLSQLIVFYLLILTYYY